MLYNSRERLARRMEKTQEKIGEVLSDLPTHTSQVKRTLLDLARRPGEYLFFGYNVGDRVSVTMEGKEVWYKIESRYTDTDTKELVYSLILVSGRSGLYCFSIPDRTSVYHKDIYRRR